MKLIFAVMLRCYPMLLLYVDICYLWCKAMVSNSAPKFDIGTKMDKESACFMMVQADVERNK